MNGQAKLYKWVDESGQIHYGERPPTGKASETIKTDKPSSTGREYSERRKKQRDAILKLSEKKNADKKEAKESAKEKAKNSEYCAQLRSTLSSIGTGRRIRQKQANGEYEYLTEDSKKKQAADIQAVSYTHLTLPTKA